MDLLERLISAFAVSGNEEAVRKIIKEEIKDYVDDIYVDKLGNLLAHKKGKHPKIMLAAHMDEVGLMVKSIDPTGKIIFSIIGGIDHMMLLGERVHIQTPKAIMHGVITCRDVSNGEIISRVSSEEDLFVDTGLTKEELEKRGVEVGSYLSLERDLYFLGSKNIICGKAFDDRIGCYILIELAKRLKSSKNEIYYVFTIQEEIGLVGAMTSTYKVQPDWAIAVDVTDTDDASPNASKKLGEGPCITIKDEETIGNKTINNWLLNVGKKRKINIQKDVSDLGTTDAASISITREGVPCTVVTVPIRNIHTTTGVANINDIKDTIRLLEGLLKKPPDTKVVWR